jgi:hypothetical protein
VKYIHTKFHENCGISVQAILKLYLRNLKGCNVGINGEKELLSVSFRYIYIYIPGFMMIGKGVERYIEF